jgi:hypothetical protein|tara:strand:- start:369 stop:542 length:174 start_codon:yes stop_codon:yes gene_type:complete
MKYTNNKTAPCFVKVDGETKLLQPGESVISKECLLSYGLKAEPTSPKPKSTKKKSKK